MLKGSYSYLSKDFILSKITEEQIFEKYLGVDITSLVDGGHFINPLRDDSNPTCTLKYINGKLKFRDWADTKTLDCFDLVQQICNNCSFLDALRIISHHFSLLGAEEDDKFKYVLPVEKLRELKAQNAKAIDLKIKRTDWSRYHINFFKKYGLELNEDLIEDTFPIKCYWVNGIKYELKTIMFAYHFLDVESSSYPYDYKIYCPYADKNNKELKFLHNNANIIQGEQQLKYNKNNLILTSSFKDVKVLRKAARLFNFDYEVAAPMSETTPIKIEKINKWKSLYENIILYHNNDKAGLKAAEMQSKLYGCGYVTNPEGEPKDPSDVVKEKDYDRLGEIIDSFLTIPF